jgi:RNA polymerase sigma factor (sigma-70 family)
MTDTPQRRFASTHWSLVKAAADTETETGRQALDRLFRLYWYPLYLFLRRQGLTEKDAEDLLQGFFVQAMEKGLLGTADPERGRFRTYLLTSLQNYLANHYRAQNAIKRGGQVFIHSLNMDSAEKRYRLEPATTLTPEEAFERKWAQTVVQQAISRLEEEWAEPGKQEVFQALRKLLVGQTPDETYQQIAKRLGKSETAIKVTVHRLRKRCGELIRNEIASTVCTEQEVESELQRLFEVLG